VTSHRTPPPTGEEERLFELLGDLGPATPVAPPGDGESRVLPELFARAVRVADADYACLILSGADGRLCVTVAVGTGAEDFRGAVFDPTESVLGRLAVAGKPARTPDVTLWAKPDFDNRHTFGPAMIIPIAAEGARGAVLMLRVAGHEPFSTRDVDLASTFATQVALAMELNDARVEAEHMHSLEERHRVAQDLHDNVIQRLFATGVGLQALLGQLTDDQLADRLRRHIADLDDTLDQIRSTVRRLQDDLEPALLQETAVPSTAPRRDVMF
jgi:signal transduction histidine kinase